MCEECWAPGKAVITESRPGIQEEERTTQGPSGNHGRAEVVQVMGPGTLTRGRRRRRGDREGQKAEGQQEGWDEDETPGRKHEQNSEKGRASRRRRRVRVFCYSLGTFPQEHSYLSVLGNFLLLSFLFCENEE